ncbi:MAG: major capsid protein [Synergistaceae bacterium]|nr:major capsid protein [Synergistaceae bacterium]
MTINYYEPKYLRGSISKILPERLFFRNRFFSESVTFPTKTVTFEFARNSRRLFPYASEYSGSVPVDRNPYQAKSFTAPLLSGSRTITPDSLAMKLLGESPYNSGMSPEDRARELAAQDLVDLTEALYRQEEYMCARVKQDGKLIIDADGVSAEVDYGFTNIENTTTANKWTSTYDILGKLAKMARELRKNGVNPDTLIVGSEVAEAINLNEGVLKLRHDTFVEIPSPDSLEDGITYVCQIRAPGVYVNVYEYDEYYEDANGELQPLIDPKTVIMQSSRERNIMLHGAVTYLDQRTNEYVTDMSDYVPYTVSSYDPPVKKLIVSSRVLPMPRDVESWLVLKNVV